MHVVYFFIAIAFVFGMLIGVLAMWQFDKSIFDDMRRVIRDQDKRIETLTSDLEIAVETARRRTYSRDSDIMGDEEDGDY